MELKEIPMDVRNRAVREALRKVQPQVAEAVLKNIGLTDDELRCLMDSINGADLVCIGGDLHLSDRTVDRRRAAALNKLREALEA